MDMITQIKAEAIRSVATRLLETLQLCDRLHKAVAVENGLLTGDLAQWISYESAIEDSCAALEWLALSVSSLLLERPEDVAAHLMRGDRMTEQRSVLRGLDELIVANTDIASVVEES